MTKNPESQNQTKYSNVMYYYVRGLVKEGELSVEYIFNLMILIDGLTKALPTKWFKKHWEE